MTALLDDAAERTIRKISDRDNYNYPPTLEECARMAWLAATEAAALKCEARRDARFAAFGTTEPDTGATYYGGRVEEEYNIRDEEDDDCAAAIRGGKP